MALLIIIAIFVIIWIIKGKGYDAARARNSIVSWATGEEGYCCECKHCIKDTANQHSQTGWYCMIGKCDSITDNTWMNCFEKPTITEDDLRELFSLGIWTTTGQEHIRQSVLGKKMTVSELDLFLKALPKQYPHYIDPEYRKNHHDNT